MTSSPETTKTLTDFPSPLAATKAWAAAHGYAGRKGGWIYRSNGRPYCQGWASLTGILTRHGILRDEHGLTMATRSGDVQNDRLRRNVFAGGPVKVDLERRP